MRYLVAITMLVLAIAMVRPVVAQSFKPDLEAGAAAHKQKDIATALKHWRPLDQRTVKKRNQSQLRIFWEFGDQQ